jgi:histone-binding protein RBBP4
VVEDVAWNCHDATVFASVSDDKKLLLWDIRAGASPTNSIEAHMAEVMGVDFSPFDSNLIITGSADRSVAVWDSRNLKSKLFSLR